MANYNSIEEFYKSLENESNLNTAMIGQEVEVQCPKCEKEINITIKKDKNYKCSKCGHEFTVELNLE